MRTPGRECDGGKDWLVAVEPTPSLYHQRRCIRDVGARPTRHPFKRISFSSACQSSTDAVNQRHYFEEDSMSANKPVGIGFIGAGEISMLHANAIHAIPEARLVGLFDILRSQTEERAQLYGCRPYTTAEELVADPEIDA